MPADIREEDRAIMQLADELATMKGRMDLLEDGQRASQLKYSSIEDGSIAVYDREGLERMRLGLQPDGSFTSSSRNNPDPPPVPRPPLLTPGFGTIKVQSQGSVNADGGWPADFSHINIYNSVNQGPQQKVGTISVDPGVFVLGPLPYEPVEVWFTAVNHSGRESANSASATATPVKVVADDVLEGVIGALQLADEAVTRAKVAVNAIGPVQLDANAVTTDHVQAHAITGEQIQANTITALNMVARTITGLQIEAETILGEHIAARQIDADRLIALSITADEIRANAITAGKIVAGAVTADKLEAVMVLATTIIAGNPIGGRVVISQDGIDAFDLAGVRTFQVDAGTGAVRMVGILESGVDGSIVRITPGDPNHPIQTPGLYLYADGSNFPALIYATPVGAALGVRPTGLQIISSLDDTAGGGHISLRDQGIQMQYARAFQISGFNPELRPVGGMVQTSADNASMILFDVNGEGEIDGGFLGVTRFDAQFGYTKQDEATQGGMLLWGGIGTHGRLAMLGKWLAYHGDPEAGMILVDIDYGVTGGTPPPYVIFDYGSPDPDWDSELGRANFTSWVSEGDDAGVMIWISEEDNEGMVIRVKGRDGLPKVGHLVLLSMGYAHGNDPA